MQIQLKTITPKFAMEATANHQNYRRYDEQRIRSIADDISNNRWRLNAETIKFNPEKELIDGQHRLRAVIRAGKPIRSYVAYGVPDDTILTIDSGKSRTLSDVLRNQGFNYPTQLSPVSNYVIRYKASVKRAKKDKRFSSSFQTSQYISRDESVKFVTDNPRLTDAIQFTHRAGQKFLRWSLHAAVFFLLESSTNTDLATAFYDPLMKGLGEDWTEKNPIYLLREKLSAERNAESRLVANAYVGLIFYAWNRWLTEGTVKHFSYNYARSGIPAIETERKVLKK